MPLVAREPEVVNGLPLGLAPRARPWVHVHGNEARLRARDREHLRPSEREPVEIDTTLVELGASDRAHAVALGFRWGLVR